MTAMTHLNNTILKSKDVINQYIHTQSYDSKLKNALLNDLEKEANPFYCIYGSLFSNKNTKALSTINIAGYFYFKYLLIIDKTLDCRDKKNNISLQQLVLSNWYHEEATKLLTTIFQDDQKFWTNWQLRKREYISAYQTDQKFIQDLEEKVFEDLADKKSAFGKTAIDCLEIINHITPEEHSKLIQSHQLFSCGLQCYDDIFDIREDFNNQQTNFALSTLLQSDKQIQNKPIESLQKFLFTKGHASALLNKSINYFLQASAIVEEIDCPLWKDVITLKITEIRQVLLQVEY